MDQAMMDAMSLGGGNQYLEDNFEAPIQVPDPSGQMVEVDPEALAMEGVGYAAKYMGKNGSTQATHLGRAETMTKAQLGQQIENEKRGYPSNLEEAEKVQELEGKVLNIEVGISQILSRLSGQSSPEKTPLSGTTGGNPESPVVPTTPQPEVFETAKQPSPLLNDSSESNEPESKQQRLRQVTLRSGKKISIPTILAQATNLGQTSDQEAPLAKPEIDLPENFGDAAWDDDPIAVVPEVEKPPAEDPKVKQVMNLVQEVNSFLATNDVHRFWRRTLSTGMHRHVGYSGWNKELQVEFNKRFEGFLKDPVFVSSICKKVIGMEMGYALGVKKAASFLVAVAGYTAFAMCGLE